MVESYLDGFQAGVGCDLGVDVSTGSQMCPGLFGVDSLELERFGQFPLLGDLADEMPPAQPAQVPTFHRYRTGGLAPVGDLAAAH